MTVGRISKQDRRKPTQQVRLLLKEGKQTWDSLRKGVKCSPTTLSSILKDLEKAGTIRSYTDFEDRRITWYEALGKKVNEQIKRYDAIRFLEDLKNPIFDEENRSIDDSIVSMSVFYEGLKHKKSEILKGSFTNFEAVAEFAKLLEMGTGADKIALVITLERSKKSSSEA